MTTIRILLDIVNTANFGPDPESCGMVVYIFGSEREKYLKVTLNFICMKRRGYILHMLRTLSRQVHV